MVQGTEKRVRRGNPIPNPISLTFQLIDRYREFLQAALEKQSLPAHQVDEILSNMDVDKGMYLSLNRHFKKSATSFRQFCRDHHLAEQLPECFNDLKKLHIHQEKAVQFICAGHHTLVATGTGSGKTEAFLIPIYNHCLQNPGPGIKAVILYPMNALANDQVKRLEKAIANTSLNYALFTGDTAEKERNQIRSKLPDILITNYVMLDRLLTRSADQTLFAKSSQSLRYVVLDEIHTYRGNKATHIKYLMARLAHFIKGNLVYIGTSATLQSSITGGYLYDKTGRLDQFIKPLLGIDKYDFVEAEYEPEEEVNQNLFRCPAKVQALDWQFELNPETALPVIGSLTGEKYSSFDLKNNPKETRPYQDMQHNAFMLRMRHELINRGSLGFEELVQLMLEMLPQGYFQKDAESLVRAYLSAIAFLNEQYKEYPLMDLRFHLFLRDIGGYLKRCLHCEKYHSGKQEHCPDCGYPLFIVYRENVHRCIGKISNRRLRWNLFPESDDSSDAYYVLLSLSKEITSSDTLNFDIDIQSQDEQIELQYSVPGRIQLEYLPAETYKDALSNAIPLANEKRDDEYLYKLIKEILKQRSTEVPKLLGFVDNREQASRLAMIFQHNFSSDFLEEFLKLHHPDVKLMLEDVLKLLKDEIPETSSEQERDLFQELELWFCQWINTPPRVFYQPDYLRLIREEQYSEIERGILSIFLCERAIQLQYPKNAEESLFIRFHRYLATMPATINLGDQGQPENTRLRRSISLGEQSFLYKDFVQKYGANRIAQTIETLADCDVLVRDTQPDGRCYYRLSPSHIYLELPSAKYATYKEIRREMFFTADVHSSEIKAEKRQIAEDNFRNGNVNVLVCTPTLELGIDIGDLNMVLMIGVPPSPSNYAQRAGRAGRRSVCGNSLIVTFCNERNEHDSYYFSFPRQMINGVITPPQFNPRNIRVVRKHVHAFMLADHCDNDNDLDTFIVSIDRHIQTCISSAQIVFRDCPEAILYLQNDFKKSLIAWREHNSQIGESSLLREQLHQSGFLPDYGFRHDQVYVIDKEKEDQLKTTIQIPNLEQMSLSDREPEMAYIKYTPGTKMFMAGDLYTISEEGNYTLIPHPTQQIRSYHYMFARREIWFAQEEKIQYKQDRSVTFTSPEGWSEHHKILGLGYHPTCLLTFINGGGKSKDKTKPFVDESDKAHPVNFSLGFQMERKTLILRFDKNICHAPLYYLSFVSGFIHTIADYYGIDESELRMVVDAIPIGQDRAEPNSSTHVLLYDFDGNGNISFERIQQDFPQLLQAMYDRLVSCQGSADTPCDDGCYLCLKSYYTSRSTSNVSRRIAIMFTGYLLDKNPFEPSIASPSTTLMNYDLTLTIEHKGDIIRVFLPGKEYSATTAEGQNQSIFTLLRRAIQEQYRLGMRSLLVKSREPYIISAINEGKLEKGLPELTRFQFDALRFPVMHAQRS